MTLCVKSVVHCGDAFRRLPERAVSARAAGRLASRTVIVARRINALLLLSTMKGEGNIVPVDRDASKYTGSCVSLQ